MFAIASLEATGLEPASADKKSLGLDPPAVSVRALDDKGAELGALSLGDPSAAAACPRSRRNTRKCGGSRASSGRQIPLSAEAFQNAFVKRPDPAPAPAAAVPPASSPAPSSPASP